MPLRNETLYEPIPSLTFDVSPPSPFSFLLGRVYWDEIDNTLAIQLAGGDYPVTLQVGYEQIAFVRNETGSDIDNGTLGYANGSLAYRPTVALSKADNILTCSVQGIATQNIIKNGDGIVTLNGIVRGFDTHTPDWDEGDLLYLSETEAGGLQNTPPSNGYCLVVGRVLRKHPTEGMIYFFPRPLPAFGNLIGGNYTAFEYDGTMRAHGNATCFRDEMQSVTSAQLTSPAGDFVQDQAEASVLVKDSARYPSDYITTNWQLNHDWVSGSIISPHLHWWQTSENIPNWLFAYRWQKQGAAKTTAWAYSVWEKHAFEYSSGTINQITEFEDIEAPSGYGDVSDIVQIRVYRDVTNVSTLFEGAELSPVDEHIINLDTHIEVDALGSRQEYTK